MYIITLSTKIIVNNGFDQNNQFIKVEPNLTKELDGYEENELKECGEDLSDHIVINGNTISQQTPKIVQPDYAIKLKYNDESSDLTAESVFLSPTKLSEDTLNQLRKEFEGQMSDGLGSIMCQKLEKKYGVNFNFYFLNSLKESTSELISVKQILSQEDNDIYINQIMKKMNVEPMVTAKRKRNKFIPGIMLLLITSVIIYIFVK